MCYKETDTNYWFLECLSVNVSTVPTLYVLFCYSDTSLQQHNLPGPFDSAIIKFNCSYTVLSIQYSISVDSLQMRLGVLGKK